MKQYDTFGEYMFDLLFAPLKRGKRAANQLYIFFKVVGRVFDGLKDDALRVRDETNIATASPAMLPVHGQDRGMPRLAGESIEAYLPEPGSRHSPRGPDRRRPAGDQGLEGRHAQQYGEQRLSQKS